MHFLNIVTITLAGLMVGVELSVSAFVNPAIWQLENTPQAQALSLLARSLSRAMSVWYGLCLALFALEAFLHRREPALIPLVIATILWAVIIVTTLLILVPINNRIARLNLQAPAPDWKQDHHRWDSLHRVRIVLLTVAFMVFASALAA